MSTSYARRVTTGIAVASLLAAAVAVPAVAAPPGGTSKDISVEGTSPIFDGIAGNLSISAGEQVAFRITVRNNGQQNVNNVNLLFGFDDLPEPASNGDATPPTAFPTGVSVTTSNAICTSGTLLACPIGSLGKGKSFVVDAVLTTAPEFTTYNDPRTLVEAVVSVAEAGSDNGSNIDTFSDQGEINLIAFNCDSITAYRPGSSSKVVSTCGLADARNLNGQSSKVVLPSALSVVTLSEVDCPSGVVCIGKEVDASIDGDGLGDVITWTIQVDITGRSVAIKDLVVQHTNDEGVTSSFGLLKSNACKRATSTNCGSATISGSILTVVIQTAGNGKTRLL